MDKSRQQFEEEFKKRVELPTSDIFKINDDTGEYYYMTPRQAWFWWQASRDSLLLSLPEREKSNNGLDRFSIAYNEGIAACEQYLLGMGVKIKNE